MSKEVMRQALDALTAVNPYIGDHYTVASTRKKITEAITALRAALDAPEPDIGRTLPLSRPRFN